jgi:O-antigen/teichoic acid export membrane protein
MSSDPDLSEPAHVTTRDVARGASLAGLARLGSLIDVIAQPLYVWMFGVATYGVYVVLWGAISLLSNLFDLSMTSALQRVVPSADREEVAHAAVKLALMVPIATTTLVALVISLNASQIAPIFSAAPEDAARLPHMIALFVWALPLWTFVEVATSAARARRAFGPEIRLRIFWEQTARLVFAGGFFLLGFDSIGLMAAHLCSLTLMVVLCVPLLGRYYDLRLLVRAPISLRLARTQIGTGLALLPSDMTRRFLVDGPPLLLNLVLPGARGAQAAGLLEIARKLSTTTNIVRLAFRYVLAPLSAAQARRDRTRIRPLYHFACRVSTALVAPLAAALVFTGADLLSVYRQEAMAALPLLYVLVAARMLESMVGPAADVVEMTGHRGLPLLNSLIAATALATLAALLIPQYDALGMAIAVAVAIVANSWTAMLELRLTDKLSPFDSWMFVILGISAVGAALMAVATWLMPTGLPHFLLVGVVLLLGTAWLALRFGLPRDDREALGGFARRVRLI